MSDSDLIRALRRIKVETGSLVCLGCGHEHNCSIYGCAVINAAIDRLEVDKSTTLGGTYVSVEWFERVEAELKKYKATGFEPEEISGLCSMSERAKLADLLRLEEYQALGTIDHIRELVQAEKNGCLIVHGRWIKPSSRAWEHYCSVCRGPKPYFYGYGALDSSFCPNCGAKLDLTGGHEK